MCVRLVGNSGRTPFPVARVRVIGCPSLSENAQGALMPCDILSQRFLALDLWRSLLDIWLGCGFNKETLVFLRGCMVLLYMCCYFLGGRDLVDGWMLGKWQKWRGFFVKILHRSSGGGRWDTRSGTPPTGDWMSLFFFCLRLKPGISRGRKWNCPSFTRPKGLCRSSPLATDHYPIRYITNHPGWGETFNLADFHPGTGRKRWGEIRLSTAGGREIWNFWDTL